MLINGNNGSMRYLKCKVNRVWFLNGRRSRSHCESAVLSSPLRGADAAVITWEPLTKMQGEAEARGSGSAVGWGPACLLVQNALQVVLIFV